MKTKVGYNMKKDKTYYLKHNPDYYEILELGKQSCSHSKECKTILDYYRTQDHSNIIDESRIRFFIKTSMFIRQY